VTVIIEHSQICLPEIFNFEGRKTICNNICVRYTGTAVIVLLKLEIIWGKHMNGTQQTWPESGERYNDIYSVLCTGHDDFVKQPEGLLIVLLCCMLALSIPWCIFEIISFLQTTT
jgi:hypothetical protein